jgi:hypothetical protein
MHENIIESHVTHLLLNSFITHHVFNNEFSSLLTRMCFAGICSLRTQFAPSAPAHFLEIIHVCIYTNYVKNRIINVFKMHAGHTITSTFKQARASTETHRHCFQPAQCVCARTLYVTPTRPITQVCRTRHPRAACAAAHSCPARCACPVFIDCVWLCVRGVPVPL